MEAWRSCSELHTNGLLSMKEATEDGRRSDLLRRGRATEDGRRSDLWSRIKRVERLEKVRQWQPKKPATQVEGMVKTSAKF